MAAKNIILYSVVIESNQNIIDSQSLPSSFQGAGTDEEALIDILCTRTNQVCDDKVTCAVCTLTTGIWHSVYMGVKYRKSSIKAPLSNEPPPPPFSEEKS